MGCADGRSPFFEVLSDVLRDFDVNRKTVFICWGIQNLVDGRFSSRTIIHLCWAVAKYGALTDPYGGDKNHHVWARNNNVTSMMRNLTNVPLSL